MSHEEVHGMASADAVELSVVGQPRAERADAARNRRKILDAATHVIATVGVRGLSMDEVARVAEVGVGTVYRRFGDLTGLANALLHERECELQLAFMMGAPPLGPGAAPVRRIVAFLHALLDRLEDQLELMLLAETNAPTARYTSHAYAVHRTHLIRLLSEAAPNLDAQFFADMLLAPLSAALISHQRGQLDMSADRIKAGTATMVARLLR
jgi:AcrR family transcriptional regulator